ncbi:prepilin-type N-terminal cleavage/methylation domain-containing protein [Tibeticola sediminis]
MPTSAVGNRATSGTRVAPGRPMGPCPKAAAGFTLLELLVVLTLIGIATAAVTLSLPDRSEAALEREAIRLAALLESARTQSRASGSPIVWEPVPGGFRWRGGVAPSAEPKWLEPEISASTRAPLMLGPEPIIAPQSVELRHAALPQRRARISTDGLHPFQVDLEG